ncbi:hypothetical protein CDAR_251561 [Caerostris darwini]|uniref:Uncharacterized protein n=1 Tax=Caerostris darwini TaxID=1538125 RepID=A0AAV4RCW4_9ARAC|nr:hypothetical protein CDAR_251561 [Caerostris darwini]
MITLTGQYNHTVTSTPGWILRLCGSFCFENGPKIAIVRFRSFDKAREWNGEDIIELLIKTDFLTPTLGDGVPNYRLRGWQISSQFPCRLESLELREMRGGIVMLFQGRA